jgi:hypothetical protein
MADARLCIGHLLLIMNPSLPDNEATSLFSAAPAAAGA